MSILPLITNVTINLAQPIPGTTNFQLSVQFNRTMNTNFTPLVVLSNTAPGSVQPVVPAGGTWNAVAVSNDTFTPPPITLSTGMDGTNNVFVSLARDLGGGQLALTNVLQVRVDVTQPPNPTLALTASNSSSATVEWSGYAAPADLDGFRVFLATSNFTSVAGRGPVSAVGAFTRASTYSGLALDQPYYAAVAAVDVAGNSSPTVTPLAFSLPSSTPPPVPVQVQAVGPASAFVSWNSYDTSSLLGFAGFRLYYETNNFTSVSNLTDRQTLGPGARSVQIDNLNRTRTYYFAVVGFNGNNAFNSNVTTAAWSDPFAGSIGANLTIGGPGQTVDILQSITIVNNAVLTVPANTTLRFAPGTGLTVQQGALHADGTALDPIFLTSANDQPGLTPAAGDWAGVTLGSGAGASVLRHVFIKYDADLTISNCAPTVEAFTALYNTGAGLNLLGTATLTTSDALLAFNDLGARQLNTAQLNLRNSVIKNNGTNAHAAGSVSLIATQNWWGSAVAGEIDATVQGSVVHSNFLASEPLLTPAIGTLNNITQTGSRDVNLRLACRTADAMRLSEDSTFTGVFFTPFTNAAAFQLSEGGGAKTVFAQFRSITGQTSAPVNVAITYVTAGPAISTFSLTEGQVLNRPLLVTGSATAPLGMAAMEFYVDNAGQATNAGGSFSQWFDVRNFSAAVHRVKLLARDTAGNFATLERNVAITPVPPPAPAITDPPADIAVNTNAVRIAGTAEPFVEVRLFRSGTILGITNASAAGTFSFANVPLVEGVNPLTALAIDTLGNAGSPVRTVVRDTVPPAALILDPPVYIYGSGLTLTWHFPATGKRANSFEVFWHTAPITNTNQASGHTLRTPGAQFTVVNPDIGYVEVSLDRDKLLSRPVTIANRGLKDLKGVTLLPPTNKTWMVLNLPANPDGSIPLPDLDVGGSNSFTVVFAPPANTALGFHQDKILGRGTNAPGTFDVNLYARITSDQFGAVQFWVDNILGFDVPNATVRLRNTSLQVELPTAQTDINGLVTITNLQEGDWSWQVNAPGHSANVGVVQIIPSQTVQVATRLNKSVVTVNFSVVPVPFTDRYEIRLEQTFETHVPLPVLVLTPSYTEFNNVAPGFEASYIVTAKNEGLIQMENLTITGSHSDAATFTPLITYVPVLLPQQTIEIPFHVTYSGTNAPSQQANPLADCLPNPLAFMDDIIPFAEGRCVRDNTLLLIAGTVAMTMRIIADVTSVLASIPEQIASYVGCVLGSLLSNFGGFGVSGGGVGPTTGQQTVQNFGQTGPPCFAAETRVLLGRWTVQDHRRDQAG